MISKTWRTLAVSILVAAIVILAPSQRSRAVAESGDDLFNKYFGNVLDGAPCYAKTFSDDFLKSHRAHKTRSIEVDLSKSNSDGSPNSPDRFQLGFGIMTRASPEWFGQTASCKSSDSSFECYLEGDGGLFRLTPIPDAGLNLETGESGIAIEGSEMLELSGKDGEDHVFALAPAKGECAAAAAFFDTGN